MTDRSDDYDLAPVDIWSALTGSDHLADLGKLVPSLLEEGLNRKALLLTGENAGGKSLAINLIGLGLRDLSKDDGVKVEFMDVGMHRRTEAGIARSFMFGDEKESSTGDISVNVVRTGIDTSRGREGYHYLVFDEPDIGLGEGYHNALGQLLADFARDMPPKCLGFIVATHSRKIAARLLEAGASSLRVGPDTRPVADWLKHGDIEKSLNELVNLHRESVEKWRAVKRFFTDARAAMKQDGSRKPGRG